jgi:hypothetical protein
MAGCICAYPCVVDQKDSPLLALCICLGTQFYIYVRKFTLGMLKRRKYLTLSITYKTVIFANDIRCIVQLADGEWALGWVVNCFFFASLMAAHTLENSAIGTRS